MARTGFDKEEGVFSRYLQALETSPEPSEEAFEEVWKEFRRRLRRVLQRRGLWQQPTPYLGVMGSSTWADSKQALDELVADAYAFVFLDRLNSLQSHLEANGRIDALVVQSLGHFVQERQSKHDPLGTRAFTVLNKAVRQASEARELFISPGSKRGKRLGHSTVLSFEEGGEGVAREVRNLLAEEVPRWNDDLLPSLVVANSTAFNRLLVTVRGKIAALEQVGIDSFRFGDLLDPLRSDLRDRWSRRFSGAFQSTLGEAGEELVLLADWPGTKPGEEFEERESLRALTRCVAAGIAGWPTKERTRKDLRRVWRLLLSRAQGGANIHQEGREEEGREDLALSSHQASSAVDSCASTELRDEIGEKKRLDIPSQRQVGRLLGIPRSRISSLYKVLGQLIQSCQSDSPSASSVDGGGEPLQPSGRTMMDLKERKASLRKQTAEAVEGASFKGNQGPKATGDSVVFGGLYARLEGEGGAIRRGSAAWGVFEWVVLGDDENEAGLVRVVPADTNPLEGPGDLAVAPDEPGGPLTLRCSLPTSLPKHLFLRAPARTLSSHRLEQARGLVATYLGSSSSEEEPLELDALVSDWNPEHQEWIDQLAEQISAEREHLEKTEAPRVDKGKEIMTFPDPRQQLPADRPRWWRSLAAGVTLAFLGLVFWNGILLRKLAETDIPTLLPEGVEWRAAQEVRSPVEIRLPKGASAVPVYLDISKEIAQQCRQYQIDLVGEDGHLLHRWDRAPLNTWKGLSFLLPRSFLEEKPVMLRLSTACSATPELIEERLIAVVLE
ncbi:MAG: hypothetical protein K0U98_04275 [Deltaproteobacteria bacterium]|nr:hypothetical protein [Deltaproteobacteria bacterium]